MPIEQITISLKDKIESIRYKSGNDSSALTFASLYMWAAKWNLKIMISDDVYTVVEDMKESPAFYFPCGETQSVKNQISSLKDEYPNLVFHYLRSCDAEMLEHEFPGMFDIYSEPDNSEYLYSVENYCELSGGDYIRIRNRIRHAGNNADLSTRPIDETNLHIITYLDDRWHEIKGFDKDVDSGAVRAFESEFFSVGGEGIIVYDGADPVAATAGYPLSDSVFDYSYSKAITDLKGLSDFSKNALAKSIRGRYKIINGEEDLGVPGLRKMKENMCPIGKIEMFTAVSI